MIVLSVRCSNHSLKELMNERIMEAQNKIHLAVALVTLLSILFGCILLNNLWLLSLFPKIHHQHKSKRFHVTNSLISVDHSTAQLFSQYPKNKKKVACSSDKIIDHLQREQWLKAVAEVFEGKVYLHISDKDLGFYHHVHGGMVVHLTSITEAGKNYSSLVYHRIPNSANHVIQSLLLELAYMKSHQQTQLNGLPCIKQQNCAHKDVEFLSHNSLRHYLVFESDATSRLAFTFVRDPIQRFLSAFTEIDMLQTRMKQAKIAKIPFKQPRRSFLRFTEFVDHLLVKGPSSLLFKEYEEVGISMIAPMVGPLSFMRTVESEDDTQKNLKRGLQVFHYENFFADWLSLAEISHIPELAVIAQHRNTRYFDENLIDLRRNSTIASMFLALADEDAKTRYFNFIVLKCFSSNE